MQFGVGGSLRWTLSSKFILDCSPKNLYYTSCSNLTCPDTGSPGWGILFHQILLGQCPRPFTCGSTIDLLWLQLLLYQPPYNRIAYSAANSGFHTVWSLWPHCVKSFIWLNDTFWWCKHGISLCKSPKWGHRNFLPNSTIILLFDCYKTNTAETVTQLSNSIGQSASWEYINHSGNIWPFMEPKVHYCVH